MGHMRIISNIKCWAMVFLFIVYMIDAPNKFFFYTISFDMNGTMKCDNDRNEIHTYQDYFLSLQPVTAQNCIFQHVYMPIYFLESTTDNHLTI